jgi:hypothetical protein
MKADAAYRAGEDPSEPITVRVEHDGRGGWSVAMPNQRSRVICETFDDARRVAYLCAARTRPCELIVHDAHHRVLHREHIDGHRDRRPSPQPATAGQTTHEGDR